MSTPRTPPFTFVGSSAGADVAPSDKFTVEISWLTRSCTVLGEGLTEEELTVKIPSRLLKEIAADAHKGAQVRLVLIYADKVRAEYVWASEGELNGEEPLAYPLTLSAAVDARERRKGKVEVSS